MHTKNVPYTTSTGIKIGLMYEHKQPYFIDRDMLLIQTALLESRIPKPNFFIHFLSCLRNRVERML